MTNHSIIDRLRHCRPGALHAIDSFKVPLEEAIEKARVLAELGFPALLLASTDWVDFEERMRPYVAALRAAVDLPVLLHFPQRRGSGLPLVDNAQAALFPFLLESTDPHFVWGSYVETLLRLDRAGRLADAPELISCAALTFGRDDRTRAVLQVEPVDLSPANLQHLTAMIRKLDLSAAYLYSRHERVPLEVVRHFRAQMAPERLLFVSGGVGTRAQIDAFIDAGADYAVFCGALERENWREVLHELVPTPQRVDRATARAAHG
jgi:heptaprenylglyceryl phosphate synthase